MKNPMIRLVLFSVIGFVSFLAPSFAQQPDLGKKQSLIMEFRRLTGADRVNIGINLSTEEIKNSMAELVEKDPDLTDINKKALRKDVEAGYSRVDKVAKDFFANKDLLNKISEEVILNLYDSAYSETELAEAIAFYKTATERKTAAFLPTLSGEAQKGFVAIVIPRVQAIVQPVNEAEVLKLKQKIAEMKLKK